MKKLPIENCGLQIENWVLARTSSHMRSEISNLKFQISNFKFQLLLLVTALLIFPALISAQTPPATGIRLLDLDGKQTDAGPLTQWSEGVLFFEGKPTIRAPAADLHKLHWTGRKLRTAVWPVVLLANGDRLQLKVESIDGEQLVGRWASDVSSTQSNDPADFGSWFSIKVPLESVRGIIVTQPTDRAVRDRTISQLLDRTDRSDVVILNNGDTVEGELLGVESKILKLKTNVGESSIDLAGVRAIGFNPELTNMPPAAEGSALVTLLDGSRFQAAKFKLSTDAKKLSLQARFGANLEIPLEAVASLQFTGGRITYLSEIQPAAYKSEPYFSLEWPLRRDRSVLGGPLRLRGAEYARGLGMHSQSEVRYQLDGKYRRFHTTIGIDDDAHGRGSVVFKIVCDDRVVFASPVLTGTSRPATLEPIDVTGMKTLTLRVEFADFGDIQDHANWCDAVLVK